MKDKPGLEVPFSKIEAGQEFVKYNPADFRPERHMRLRPAPGTNFRSNRANAVLLSGNNKGGLCYYGDTIEVFPL